MSDEVAGSVEGNRLCSCRLCGVICINSGYAEELSRYKCVYEVIKMPTTKTSNTVDV